MIEMDRINQMLDEIVMTFPRDLFTDLNGGVVLNPNVKYHPEAKDHDLYILGEYNHSYMMGRYIVIYGGSFQKMFGNSGEEVMRSQLEHTLKHEFTHHMESMAGEKDLEITDAVQLQRYRDRQAQNQNVYREDENGRV